MVFYFLGGVGGGGRRTRASFFSFLFFSFLLNFLFFFFLCYFSFFSTVYVCVRTQRRPWLKFLFLFFLWFSRGTLYLSLFLPLSLAGILCQRKIEEEEKELVGR